ncbi:hypothetical protein TYRP_008620 [Tyrophagus putrescentiae]|nr:hypothetical protein TYRP_008620 [Tyrophagus putrescentiae]
MSSSGSSISFSGSSALAIESTVVTADIASRVPEIQTQNVTTLKSQETAAIIGGKWLTTETITFGPSRSAPTFGWRLVYRQLVQRKDAQQLLMALQASHPPASGRLVLFGHWRPPDACQLFACQSGEGEHSRAGVQQLGELQQIGQRLHAVRRQVGNGRRCGRHLVVPPKSRLENGHKTFGVLSGGLGVGKAGVAVCQVALQSRVVDLIVGGQGHLLAGPNRPTGSDHQQVTVVEGGDGVGGAAVANRRRGHWVDGRGHWGAHEREAFLVKQIVPGGLGWKEAPNVLFASLRCFALFYGG